MLTLAQAKGYLKLAPVGTDADEDEEVQGLLDAVVSMFRVESKRRWPAIDEPTEVLVVDADTAPPTTVFLRYVDPAVLTEDEQKTALLWVRLNLGHFYENRQTVIVGVNMTEVPHTAKMLMNLLRVPTL